MQKDIKAGTWKPKYRTAVDMITAAENKEWHSDVSDVVAEKFRSWNNKLNKNILCFHYSASIGTKPRTIRLFGHIPARYYGLLGHRYRLFRFVVRYQYRTKSAMTVWTAVLLLLFQHPHQTRLGCLFPVSRNTTLHHSGRWYCLYSSCPMEVGNGPAMQVSRQSWRHAGADDSPMAVLPQDEMHYMDVLDMKLQKQLLSAPASSPCQSDELRNYRQSDRCALGISVFG